MSLVGWLQYTADEAFVMDGEPLSLEDYEIEDHQIFAATWSNHIGSRTFGANMQLSELCEKATCKLPQTAFVVSKYLAETLINNHCSVVATIPLGLRHHHSDSIQDEPTRSHIKKWIRERQRSETHATVDHALHGGNKALFELPFGTPEFPTHRVFIKEGQDAKVFDACAVLKYLKFGKHLKALEDADLALNDALEFACTSNELLDEVTGQLPERPRKSALHHARMKLDAVAMNIERREFADLLGNRPHELESAHLFTDASPVTGTELQGMVLELFLITGMLMKVVMPGVVLHFGGTRLIDRIIAFLWSLTLMIGTDYKLCKFLLSRFVQ